MRKSVFIAFLIAVFLAIPLASAHTMTVRLNIGNTQNTVYVPGQGELASGGLGPEQTILSPPHYYLASYSGGLLAGLAAKSGESLALGSGSGSHFLQIKQNLTGSRTYLVSSEGDWHAMDSRISLIETGKFLSQISPSFAFPLGGLYPLRLLLKYSNIDLQGDFITGKGQSRLVIENKGVSGGRPVVEIRKG